MLRKILFLIGLTICLNSCVKRTTVQFDIPERSALPQAAWTANGELYCTDEAGARAILEREVIREAYEQKLKAVIEGCNKALK